MNNVLGQTLQLCGSKPMTGYDRKGYCSLDINDKGTHTGSNKKIS
jgi:uncharacterized protein (DUF2237 family)